MEKFGALGALRWIDYNVCVHHCDNVAFESFSYRQDSGWLTPQDALLTVETFAILRAGSASMR